MKRILITGYLLLATTFSTALFSTAFSSAAYADEIRLAPNAPEVYLVKEGDTLWGIASMFLEDPWLLSLKHI